MNDERCIALTALVLWHHKLDHNFCTKYPDNIFSKKKNRHILLLLHLQVASHRTYVHLQAILLTDVEHAVQM